MNVLNLDDPTVNLLRATDEKIRRAEIIIEQQRLHIAQLHPSRRGPVDRALKDLQSDYVRLLDYRKALLSKPSCAFMN